MTKQIVNENEYIAIMNQELRKHPEYEEGMEIVGNPEGGIGADLRGINHKGPAHVMPALVSELEHALKEKYQVRLTPRKEKT